MGDHHHHEAQQKPEQEPLLLSLSGNNHISNLNDQKMNDIQRRRRPRHGSTGSSSENNNINKEEENLIHQIPPLPHLDYSDSFKSKKLVLFLLSGYLGLGTLSFFLIRHQIKGIETNGFLDALYFCVVTMTTVGYGDLVPNSKLAKLLACFYVFTGMALVGMIMSKAADYFLEKQEILFVRAIIHMGEKVGPLELLEEVEAHKVKYKFFIASAVLVMLMIVGIVFLCLVENLEFVDAFYCVCSTITTLGYGDKSFSTNIGRGFAVFWILSSTICLAQFFYYLAELYTEGRQKSLIRTVLSRKLLRSDLEAADLDHDNAVSAAEFIVYKLKEMGRINQQDISTVMDAFRKLDFDKSGTLTEADLKFSASS